MSATLHRDAGAIDTAGPVFAARLASTLRTSREHADLSLRKLAKASGGAFSAGQLREIERGRFDLTGVDLPHLSALYDVDLSGILLERVPLVVDPDLGRIDTAGISRLFDTGDQDALLVAYLTLVRELRDLRHEPKIELRRDDIDVLAATLRTDGQVVLERLGELMHLTVAERRSLVLAFVTGATIFALAGGAIAVDDGSYLADSGDTSNPAAALSEASDDLSAVAAADVRTVTTETAADSAASGPGLEPSPQPGPGDGGSPQASSPALDTPPEPAAQPGPPEGGTDPAPVDTPSPGGDRSGSPSPVPMPDTVDDLGGDPTPRTPDPGATPGSNSGTGPGSSGSDPSGEQPGDAALPGTGGGATGGSDATGTPGDDTGQPDAPDDGRDADTHPGRGNADNPGLGHGVNDTEPGAENAPGSPAETPADAQRGADADQPVDADQPTDPDAGDAKDETGKDTTGKDRAGKDRAGKDRGPDHPGIGHGVTDGAPGSEYAPGNPA